MTSQTCKHLVERARCRHRPGLVMDLELQTFFVGLTRGIVRRVQEKFERITEIKGTMQEMEEVDSWQAEMDHLNK